MNITVLLCKTNYNGTAPPVKEVINLDIPTLKRLIDESSMLIFEHGNNDIGEIILDAYAKT